MIHSLKKKRIIASKYPCPVLSRHFCHRLAVVTSFVKAFTAGGFCPVNAPGGIVWLNLHATLLKTLVN